MPMLHSAQAAKMPSTQIAIMVRVLGTATQYDAATGPLGEDRLQRAQVYSPPITIAPSTGERAGEDRVAADRVVQDAFRQHAAEDLGARDPGGLRVVVAGGVARYGSR
jgi:hypothetical protein